MTLGASPFAQAYSARTPHYLSSFPLLTPPIRQFVFSIAWVSISRDFSGTLQFTASAIAVPFISPVTTHITKSHCSLPLFLGKALRLQRMRCRPVSYTIADALIPTNFIPSKIKSGSQRFMDSAPAKHKNNAELGLHFLPRSEDLCDRTSSVDACHGGPWRATISKKWRSARHQRAICSRVCPEEVHLLLSSTILLFSNLIAYVYPQTRKGQLSATNNELERSKQSAARGSDGSR